MGLLATSLEYLNKVSYTLNFMNLLIQMPSSYVFTY